MPENRYGFLSNAYRNAASHNSPTWGELDLISECSVNHTHDELAASARVSSVHSDEPGMGNLEISMSIRKDPTDALFQAVHSAVKNRSEVDMMFLDGELSENRSRGYRYTGKFHGWEEEEGLQSVVYINTTFIPCVSDNDPEYVVVTGGNPVFTTME